MASLLTKVKVVAQSVFETTVWLVVSSICIVLMYKDRVDRWLPIISALVGMMLPSPILSKEETNNEGVTNESASDPEQNKQFIASGHRVHLRDQPKRLILAGIVFTFTVSWGLQGSFGLHSIFITNAPKVESNILLHLNCSTFDVGPQNYQLCSNAPRQDFFVLHVQNSQDELGEILVLPLNSTSITAMGMSCLEMPVNKWFIYDRLDQLLSEIKLLAVHDRIAQTEAFSGDFDSDQI